MKGAIFYSTKYGSTEQYAIWLGEATSLPVFNVKEKSAIPADYDFLVIGAPIIYYKLYNRHWMKRNWSSMENKSIVFFTVSGAPPGEKLAKWFNNSLPKNMIANMQHVGLQGRQKPEELTWFDRGMLQIAAKFNKDRKAAREEGEGFDYMDRSSIEPIVKIVRQWQSKEIEKSEQRREFESV